MKLTVTIEHNDTIKSVGREFTTLPTPEYFKEQGCNLIESSKRTFFKEQRCPKNIEGLTV